MLIMLTQWHFSCIQQKPEEESSQSTGRFNPKADQQISDKDSSGYHNSLPPTPEGIRLGEFYGSDDNIYSFFSRDSVKFLSGKHYYKLGTWTMQNDSIIIRYRKLVWREGIGEPHKRPKAIPGNWQDTYDDYKIHHEQIDEIKILHWQQIREHLEKDPEYPYQVINQNIYRIEGFMENYFN